MDHNWSRTNDFSNHFIIRHYQNKTYSTFLSQTFKLQRKAHEQTRADVYRENFITRVTYTHKVLGIATMRPVCRDGGSIKMTSIGKVTLCEYNRNLWAELFTRAHIKNFKSETWLKIVEIYTRRSCTSEQIACTYIELHSMKCDTCTRWMQYRDNKPFLIETRTGRLFEFSVWAKPGWKEHARHMVLLKIVSYNKSDDIPRCCQRDSGKCNGGAHTKRHREDVTFSRVVHTSFLTGNVSNNIFTTSLSTYSTSHHMNAYVENTLRPQNVHASVRSRFSMLSWELRAPIVPNT